MVLDDIYLNDAMDRVWGTWGAGAADGAQAGALSGRGDSFDPSVRDSRATGTRVCKYDLTDLGHTVAGTGVLDFSCSSLAAVTSPFIA